MPIREQAVEFLGEDTQKTAYRTNSETMAKRLLTLGIVIDHILSHSLPDKNSLLRRMFSELYEKTEDGIVSARYKKHIISKSVQNPNDPDAEDCSKAGKKVKGYSANITETCDEKDKPRLITPIDLEEATTDTDDTVSSSFYCLPRMMFISIVTSLTFTMPSLFTSYLVSSMVSSAVCGRAPT